MIGKTTKKSSNDWNFSACIFQGLENHNLPSLGWYPAHIMVKGAMKRIYTILIPAILCWAVMLFWLVRYEAFPSFFSPEHQASYEAMLSGGPIIVDTWMKVLINGNHVGYTHSSVDVDEENPNERYSFSSKTVLRISLLGSPQYISVYMGAKLNTFYALQRFSMSLENATYSMKLTAVRLDGDRFLAKMETPAGKQNFAVELPEDVVIYSPAMDAYIYDLKPGERYLFNTLDPMTLTPMPMSVTAQGDVPFDQNGTQVTARLFLYDFNGAQSKTWMNDEGDVLLQETPWGWSMEASTPEQAVAFPRGNETFDLARSFSVPLKEELANPRDTTEWAVDLTGIPLASFPLESRRQSIVSQSNNTIRLRIQRYPAPDPDAQSSSNDLAATTFIQSTNAAIVARAKKIIAHAASPREQAEAINTWVFRHVIKDPTVSLPVGNRRAEIPARRLQRTHLFIRCTGTRRRHSRPHHSRTGLLRRRLVLPRLARRIYRWTMDRNGSHLRSIHSRCHSHRPASRGTHGSNAHNPPHWSTQRDQH